MPVLLLLLALVLGLAACGDDDAPSSALRGELRYVKSGGIAGDHVELVVQPSGEARLTSLRGGERTFRLSEDEIASLAQSADGFSAEDATAARAVPDAFVYTVTYDGRTARTDDPNLRKSGFSPLIGELQAIVDAHRP